MGRVINDHTVKNLTAAFGGQPPAGGRRFPENTSSNTLETSVLYEAGCHAVREKMTNLVPTVPAPASKKRIENHPSIIRQKLCKLWSEEGKKKRT